jgi:hypothetical protein
LEKRGRLEDRSDLLDLWGQRDIKERRALMALREHRVLKEMMENREAQESREPPVR